MAAQLVVAVALLEDAPSLLSKIQAHLFVLEYVKIAA